MNSEMQQLQKKFTIYQFIVSKLNISKNAGKFPCETSGIKCFYQRPSSFRTSSFER